MHFNLNHSLKQPELSSADYEIVETKIPVSFELATACNFQNSMNENEKNFQYLEHLEVEILNTNFKSKDSVFIVREISAKRSNSYGEEVVEENKSLEGLILKELPEYLKYAFLQPEKGKPFIILVGLTKLEEQKLLETLRKFKEAIAWSIEHLKGISPLICMHKILLKENARTFVEHLSRLNPVKKKVVKKEVLKRLNAGFIYAISDSPWVSPVHVVPEKGRFTMMRNEKNELMPTRTVTR